MAINTLEMAKIFQQELDKQMLTAGTSGWMEANASDVKYNGGDTVRMPMISTSGLAKYLLLTRITRSHRIAVVRSSLIRWTWMRATSSR